MKWLFRGHTSLELVVYVSWLNGGHLGQILLAFSFLLFVLFEWSIWSVCHLVWIMLEKTLARVLEGLVVLVGAVDCWQGTWSNWGVGLQLLLWAECIFQQLRSGLKSLGMRTNIFVLVVVRCVSIKLGLWELTDHPLTLVIYQVVGSGVYFMDQI